MTRPRLGSRQILPVLTVALAALAAGCSSETGGTGVGGTGAMRGAQDVLAQTVGARRPAPMAPGAQPVVPGLTRAALDQIGAPADLVTIERRAASALVFRAGENRGVETWVSGDDKSVSWREGVIVATRGLGRDLIAAEVPSAARIAAGGRWARLHVQLDDLDQTVTTRFDCTATRAGTARIVILERTYDAQLVQESCTAPDGRGFVNDYWFAPRGILRQSRQWIDQDIGHVAVRRLRD